MIESVDDQALLQDKNLIAPCGMNCSLCIAYQFRILDINKQGFHRR